MLRLRDCRRASNERRRRVAGCEFYNSGAAFRANANDVALIGEHVSDAARDGGGGVKPDDRPRRQRIQFVEQQRVVRAAENDDVGSGSPIVYKAGRDLAGDGVIFDNRAACAHLRQLGERGRANEVESRSSPKSVDQLACVLARDRTRRCEHRDKPAFRERGGGLDGGDSADKRDGKRFPERAQRNSGGCIAGKDDAIRLEVVNLFLNDPDKPGREDACAFRAVRKASIVSDEKNSRFGNGLMGSAQDRKTA